jgi:uncharacterized protein
MSDNLRVPLSAVSAAQDFTVDIAVGEADLRPEGAAALDLVAAALSGVLSTVGNEFLFNGSITADFRRGCDRCLEIAERQFVQDARWTFAPSASKDLTEGLPELDGLDTDNEDADMEPVRHVQGDEINLASPLWEELVLMAPAKFLCDDECMGLCPQCGANKNSGDCGCASEHEETTGHSGLAALKDLFPGFGGGSSEE